MPLELQQDEQVIKEGAANLQKNIETVGGWLYLTTQRLIFVAHKLNVQGGTTEISLQNIERLALCWTKFLGKIPLFPNSFLTETKDECEYRFVVFGRKSWVAAIDAQAKQ